MIRKVQKGAESPSNPVSSDPTSCLGEKPLTNFSCVFPELFCEYASNFCAVCRTFVCFYFTVHCGDCVISLKQAPPHSFLLQHSIPF